MESLAKRLLFNVLDLGAYFETDKEEVKLAVEQLTKELETLDKNSMIYNYLVESVEHQEVNEDVWKQFFRE